MAADRVADGEKANDVDDLASSFAGIKIDKAVGNIRQPSQALALRGVQTLQANPASIAAASQAKLLASPLTSALEAEVASISARTGITIQPATFKPLREYQLQLIETIQRYYLNLCACDCNEAHKRKFRPTEPVASDHLAGSMLRPGLVVPEAYNDKAPASALLYLPTGGGKTRIAGEIIKRVVGSGGRALFVVNRTKLADQAYEAFAALGLELDIGLIVSGRQPDSSKAVQIAMIQTLAARWRKVYSEKKENIPSSGPSEAAEVNADGGGDHNSGDLSAPAPAALDDDHELVAVLQTKSTGFKPSGVAAETSFGEVAESDRHSTSKSTDAEVFPVADVVICDEAHGTVAASYERMLKFYRKGYGSSRQAVTNASAAASSPVSPSASSMPAPDRTSTVVPVSSALLHRHTFILGLTATPIRRNADEKLNDVFEVLVKGPSVSQLVNSGVLVHPIAIRASSDTVRAAMTSAVGRGEARVKARANSNATQAAKGNRAHHRDLAGNQLFDDGDSDADDAVPDSGKQIDDSKVLDAVTADSTVKHAVETWKLHCKNRKTICFAVDIDHSKAIVRAFNAVGIPAAHIDGSMSSDARERIYTDVASGEVLILSSVGVLSEGYDEPSISAVMLLRPTTSRALYVQQVGRGLRSHPGKKNCLVLDFVDNTFRHGPVTKPIVSDLDSTVSGPDAGLQAHETQHWQPRAWVCTDAACCAWNHPLNMRCVRCTKRRRITTPKQDPVSGGQQPPALAPWAASQLASAGLSVASASGTNLISSSGCGVSLMSMSVPKKNPDHAGKNAAVTSTAAPGKPLASIPSIPRKITPGLSLARAQAADAGIQLLPHSGPASAAPASGGVRPVSAPKLAVPAAAAASERPARPVPATASTSTVPPHALGAGAPGAAASAGPEVAVDEIDDLAAALGIGLTMGSRINTGDNSSVKGKPAVVATKLFSVPLARLPASTIAQAAPGTASATKPVAAVAAVPSNPVVGVDSSSSGAGTAGTGPSLVPRRPAFPPPPAPDSIKFQSNTSAPMRGPSSHSQHRGQHQFYVDVAARAARPVEVTPSSTPASTNHHGPPASSIPTTSSSTAGNSGLPFSHNATPAIFESQAFAMACDRLRLPRFDLRSIVGDPSGRGGVSSAEPVGHGTGGNRRSIDFLLSIAAQITPGYQHSLKKHENESRGLSQKQREMFGRIVAVGC